MGLENVTPSGHTESKKSGGNSNLVKEFDWMDDKDRKKRG